MTLEEFTEERIMADVEKLQYLFRLKQVTRYNTPRSQNDETESVAEHLFGMHILAHYFLPLEDPDHTLDTSNIAALIMVHDMDEIETGDFLSYIKTATHRQEAQAAYSTVLTNTPSHMQETFATLLAVYEAQSTIEAKFVKAIDKIEPLLQLYSETGRTLCHRNKCSAADSLRIKSPYIESFPFIKAFALTLHATMETGGYFWREEL